MCLCNRIAIWLVMFWSVVGVPFWFFDVEWLGGVVFALGFITYVFARIYEDDRTEIVTGKHN